MSWPTTRPPATAAMRWSAAPGWSRSTRTSCAASPAGRSTSNGPERPARRQHGDGRPRSCRRRSTPPSTATCSARRRTPWPDFHGAIVVLERDTGRVLAMVSSPGFDPNLFDTRNPNWQYGLSGIYEDQRNPLINRATQSSFPLGSVFKMITMSAGSGNGALPAGHGLQLHGRIHRAARADLLRLDGRGRASSLRRAHVGRGVDALVQPLLLAHRPRPCSTRAIRPRSRTWPRPSAWVRRPGSRSATRPAWCPTRNGSSNRPATDWRREDSMQLAIGQSALNVTPLQVARFVAAIGNGGTLYQPQLVESDSERRRRRLPPIRARSPRRTLPDLGRDPGGGAAGNEEGRQLAARDGLSALPQLPHHRLRQDRARPKAASRDPHAWFAGYTVEGREDKPDIAVVVLAENQGQGSDWAAPIFRRVLEAYFFGQPFMPYPWESQIGVPQDRHADPRTGRSSRRRRPPRRERARDEPDPRLDRPRPIRVLRRRYRPRHAALPRCAAGSRGRGAPATSWRRRPGAGAAGRTGRRPDRGGGAACPRALAACPVGAPTAASPVSRCCSPTRISWRSSSPPPSPNRTSACSTGCWSRPSVRPSRPRRRQQDRSDRRRAAASVFDLYRGLDYPVFYVSAKQGKGVEELREALGGQDHSGRRAVRGRQDEPAQRHPAGPGAPHQDDQRRHRQGTTCDGLSRSSSL